LFLRTRKIASPVRRSLSARGEKDLEKGLRLDLPVVVYSNRRETKDFLEREARKLVPGLKRKSGARYRLNRWREAQLAAGVRITYRDLVKEYVRLSETQGSFPKIPHGRYVNFLSDFFAAEEGATREQAIEAWKTVKSLDAPKTYAAWVRSRSSKKG